MSNILTQNKNENVIYRQIRDTILVKGKFETNGLYSKINNELNKSESFYTFPENNKLVVSIYDNNSYNLFFMQDEQMYMLFKSVVSLIKEACIKYEFSYLKNKYFLYSSLVDNQDPDFWYDASGTSRPSMFGIVSLDSENTKISINGTEIDVEPGDILISEAGSKIVYSNPFNSIVFYISPLSQVKSQYSQKWIPLV